MCFFFLFTFVISYQYIYYNIEIEYHNLQSCLIYFLNKKQETSFNKKYCLKIFKHYCYNFCSLIDQQMNPRHRERHGNRNKRAVPVKRRRVKKLKRKFRNRRRRRQLRKLRMNRAINGRYTIVGQYARYREVSE